MLVLINERPAAFWHYGRGTFDYPTDAELLELGKFAMAVEGYKQMDERLKFDRVPPSKQKLGKRRWNISSELVLTAYVPTTLSQLLFPSLSVSYLVDAVL